jgi:type II secretory pathway pseudopilin PulG
MKARSQQTPAHGSQRGYALLMVVFFVTVLLISAVAVAPNILTEGKREKEKEMVWRGKQYARGVKLYYRKMGRFPTSLDDLTKPKTGSLRFMRQAYKDPMNKEDGEWRLIYVGAAGQLIGSLKPPQNLQLPQAAAPGAPANPSGEARAGAPPQPGTTGPPGQTVTQPGGSPTGTNPPATAGTDGGTGQNDPLANPPAGSGSDTSTIIGGNIIGVGSKINKRSIMVYEKAKNYRLFEFIWDPSKDNMGVGQPGMQTGTGLGQPPGQTPFGQQPGQTPFGQQPAQNPLSPPLNPPPNPPLQQ